MKLTKEDRYEFKCLTKSLFRNLEKSDKKRILIEIGDEQYLFHISSANWHGAGDARKMEKVLPLPPAEAKNCTIHTNTMPIVRHLWASVIKTQKDLNQFRLACLSVI